ncbi:MAG TPA: ATP-binding protein [Gemmatimonadales bacterium]|nr:ATP-binding protein [Gemmatimonadales bacterium]
MTPSSSRPLVATVAWRVAATVFLTLLLAAAWGYVHLRTIISDQLDQALRSGAALELAALAQSGALPVQGTAPLPDFIQAVNRFAVLRDSTGRIIRTNVAEAGGLPADSIGLTGLADSLGSLRTISWAGHGRVRSLTVRVPHGAGQTLQVAASLVPLEERLESLRWQFAALALAATLLALAGSALLTRDALRPVTRIAEQTRRLEAGTVGQRIQAAGRSRETDELVEVLNDLLARVDRAFDWQRRLVADLAHDLRTPITVLRGNTEGALLRERTAEQYRSILASNLEEIDRLALMSEALLLLARFQAGALVPHHTSFDLAEVAAEAVSQVREHAGANIEASLPESAVLEADRRMVALQLRELLQNALQHTPPGTPIRVAVEPEANTIRYLVEDGGPGVPEATMPRLFELGFRNDQARGRAAGAGLGLTVSAAIAAVHAGRIEATRSPLGGLRVAVTLPRTPGPAPRSDRAGTLTITSPLAG